MIKSEILTEKYRVQRELSQKYPTARAYSQHAELAAKEVAKKYGFSLRYVELPSNKLTLNLPAIESVTINNTDSYMDIAKIENG